MPTVYSYLRFSHPDQLNGDSLRRQLDRSKAWAEKHKLTLDDSLDLRDLGVSAFKGKNVASDAALGKFLEAIETGRVKPGDVLVLENLDRLSRDDVFSKAFPLAQRIINAGVSIVTLDPERTYSPASVKEIGPLLEMLLGLYLANEESRKKAERQAHVWATKRSKAGEKKLTARCPAWLRPTADGKGFAPIPERVEVVRRVFGMAADGAGYTAILKKLNADQVPTFGNGKRRAAYWIQSSVKKLLSNRAVLGEYQPHRVKDGRRVPVGDPVMHYYPAVVDPTDFYSAQQSRAARVGKGGRNGEAVTNLFTGLLKDARDGSSLVVVNKGAGPTLVSASARAGQGVYLSFPYPAFEQALLVWGWDLKLDDALPKKPAGVGNELIKTEGRVADLDDRIAKLTPMLKVAPDLNAIVTTLTELDAELKAERMKLERLRAEAAVPVSDAASGLKALLASVKKATGDELFALRLKLRRLLARLIEDIVVLVVAVNGERVAVVDVKLLSGVRRRVTVGPVGKLVRLPKGMDKLDVRDWANWPDECRKARFATVSAEAAEMVRLEEKAGMSRQEIAARLGTSVTRVSRTLMKLGRRKRTKKLATDPRVMNFHAAGCGWAKTFKGKRYFVGLGTLAELYPKLVTGRTADGSWRAANQWWADHTPTG